MLQKQYDAMLIALENAKSARVSEIDSWKPTQTPMSGNLVLKISNGLAVAAGVAFPEVAFLEIAKKGIEITIKGKEQLDKRQSLHRRTRSRGVEKACQGSWTNCCGTRDMS